MVSLQALRRVAAVGAVLSFGGAYTIYKFMKNSVMETPMWKAGVQTATTDTNVLQALGGKATVRPFAVFDKRNSIHECQASIVIHCDGADGEEGVLTVKASRPSNDASWTIDDAQFDLEWPETKHVNLQTLPVINNEN